MSPIAIKTFRSIPTKYELNGPSLSFSTGSSQQPSSVTINNQENASFTGIVTVTYPSTFTTTGVAGTFSYQWYDQDGIVINESRFNDVILGTTVISGADTNTLTIINAVNPTDTNRQYYVVANFYPTPSPSSKVGNAVNNPLKSNTATLTVKPYLFVITQPTDQSETVENSVTFNTSASVSDGTNSQISYQWRLNGVNLSNGTFSDRVVSGANSQSLTIKVTTAGTYSVDCVISHPLTYPSSITTNSATYESLDNAREIIVETMQRSSPEDWENSPTGVRYNISNNPLTITRQGNDRNLFYLHAPDKDVDVLITLAGPAANGSNSGQGGWMTFRYTLKQGVEHTIILGGREDGGNVKKDSSGRQEGERGAGAAWFYRLNRLTAVSGGGGGGSKGGAGGDGSGANITSGSRKGSNGQGINGGLGGDGGPNNNSPGAIVESGYEYYWFTGLFNSNNSFEEVATKVNLDTPDSQPSNILGPAYSFDGNTIVLDYRSNKTYDGSVGATRGVPAFEYPKGATLYRNSLGNTNDDCYRIVKKQDGSGYDYIQDNDKNTTNNIVTVNVADFRAGRRSILFSGVDSSQNWIGDQNSTVPNTYRNLIGNGLGQTPGTVINFHDRAVKIENVGTSDNINDNFNGTPRKTKAFNPVVERDNPRNAYGFVAKNSAEIIRGYKFGVGGRLNGGWSRFGGAGGGSGSRGGGCGSGHPTWSGGGGGGGWAGNGATVYQSVTGGNTGDAFCTIWAVDSTKTIESQLPPEPVPPNLKWQVLNWDDTRNFGWKQSADGERWPTEESGGASYSQPSCSTPNATFMQSPLVKKSDGTIYKKGGLDEGIRNYHRLFNTGCSTSDSTSVITDLPGFSGNLYFTRPIMLGQNSTSSGDTLWTPLRISSTTSGLDEIAYVDFELKLSDWGASRFETSKGSQIYTNENRPDERAPEDVFIGDSSTKQKDYYYSQSKPPSKYLFNSNGVRKRWSPFTDRQTSSGSIPYPSSDWTYSFNDAYIPFEVKFILVLEFRDIRYHETDEGIGDTAMNQWKKIEYITDWIDFGSPWQSRTIDIRSSDLWNTTHYSGKGSGSKFYPYNSSIWNYKDPFISKFEVYQIRDKDTGGINTLNLYPVLGTWGSRPYVKLEVGRGILL